MVSLAFGRHLRITKRPLFQQCYSRGRRYFTDNFIVFVRANKLSHWRLGIAAPRKTGTAVARNRIKRLIREFFRLHQHQIELKADIVVVCKSRKQFPELVQSQVNQELMEFFQAIDPAPFQAESAARKIH